MYYTISYSVFYDKIYMNNVYNIYEVNNVKNHVMPPAEFIAPPSFRDENHETAMCKISIIRLICPR